MNTGLKYILLTTCAAVCAMTTGCTTVQQAFLPVRPAYQPENVFIADGGIPQSVRRVAVLPMSCDVNRSDLMDGRDVLSSILLPELIRTKKFEVVQISKTELRQLTGRTTWTGTEMLPDGFFSLLREKYGCDAVLFGELTDFRGYAPLAIGWRLRLVDTHSCAAIWAVDEHFDAGEQAVQAGVRRYQHREQRNLDIPEQEWAALNSPRRFGQYAAAQLFETLPGR